jgi:hypothetical protein
MSSDEAIPPDCLVVEANTRIAGGLVMDSFRIVFPGGDLITLFPRTFYLLEPGESGKFRTGALFSRKYIVKNEEGRALVCRRRFFVARLLRKMLRRSEPVSKFTAATARDGILFQ